MQVESMVWPSTFTSVAQPHSHSELAVFQNRDEWRSGRDDESLGRSTTPVNDNSEKNAEDDGKQSEKLNLSHRLQCYS